MQLNEIADQDTLSQFSCILFCLFMAFLGSRYEISHMYFVLYISRYPCTTTQPTTTIDPDKSI